MIVITVKHKRPEVAEKAAKHMGQLLKDKLGNRIMGPSVPGIARLRGLYQQQIIIKMEKNKQVIEGVKAYITEVKNEILFEKGRSSVRIVVDVDP